MILWHVSAMTGLGQKGPSRFVAGTAGAPQ